MNLPRDVDRDHVETHTLDRFKNLIPLVSVEPPVVYGTTVKRDCLAIDLEGALANRHGSVVRLLLHRFSFLIYFGQVCVLV